MRLTQPLCKATGRKVCYWNQEGVCQGCGYPAGLDWGSLANVSVLVVSTNEVQCQALKVQLDSWGLVTEALSTPTAFLETLNASLARKKPYRLIFVDTDLEDRQATDIINQIIHDDRLENSAVIALLPLFANLENFVNDGEKVLYLNTPFSCSSLFERVSAIILNERFVTKTPLPNEMLIAKTSARTNFRPGLRVLIAEDNRINQIVIVELLSNAGLKTKVVTNGQEACDAVRNETFDAVLMDCQMPQMDGYEATAQIRIWEKSLPNAPRLPIIALTANATRGDAEKCLQAGMDAYCKKPIDQKQILELIDRWTAK
jgi:CheY-like chemotaxis protein